MPGQNGRAAAPDELGSQHIVFLLFHHDRATHGARVLHPVRQADGNDDDVHGHVVAVALGQHAACNTEDQQRHQNHGEGELHIGNAHEHGVKPATGIARNQAQWHANDERQRHSSHTHNHRHAQAVEDGGVHVTPLVIGTQRVEHLTHALAPGGREGIHQVQIGRFKRVVQRQQRCKYSGQHQQSHHASGYLHQTRSSKGALDGRVTGFPARRFYGISHLRAPYFLRRRGSTSTYRKSTNRLITTYSRAMNIR